jgi:DNA invertase Pin-like site-specific DNA recombinase
MTAFGYARASTFGQAIAAQDAAMRAGKVFSEKAGGTKTDRAALAKAVAALRVGVLVFTPLRSARDIDP